MTESHVCMLNISMLALSLQECQYADNRLSPYRLTEPPARPETR